MAEVYRFRSAERLLCESQELERQTIYFAAPNKLNDPVEAMRDVFWRGDSIAWTNLFKNYVFCVHRAYLDCAIGGPEVDFESRRIWVDGRRDEPESPQMGELFDEIWNRVHSEFCVGESAAQIGAMDRDVRLHEMLMYLYGVHARALRSVTAAHARRGLGSQPDGESGLETLRKPILPITQIETLAAQAGLDDSVHEQVHEGLTQALAARFVVARYDGYKDSGNQVGIAHRQLHHEFPKLYLRHLPNLMWPVSHVASFCNTYHSSAMWANYANNHTGACLVFETSPEGEDRALSLHAAEERDDEANQGAQASRQDFRFRDMEYEERLPEEDFFQNLGLLPEPVAMKLWYTDDEGSVSSCAAFLQDRSQIGAWRDEHWQAYERVTFTKTSDWAHEEETRLLYRPPDGESPDADTGLMRYDFGSLKGIIFGINMAEEHKMKMIEIVERKCRENGRNGFKCWQAYYSPQQGNIQRG